jgi:glycosyltransferase involved in cell wall biosynthesis
MSTWQRIQLMALKRLTDIGFASTEPWVGRDKFGPRATRSQLLPVGSNLPDARSERSSQRHLLGLTAADVVLATFGTPHPSFLSGHVIQSANALSAHSPVTLLNLGALARPLLGLHPGVRLVTPGEMPTHDLAATLATTDIYLAPFSDGVSTRRTTVAAALQHALPVVGTLSHSTGPLLRNAPGLVLAASDDPDGFVEAVLRLGRDAAERQHVAVQGRAFFEELLSWPRIAARLTSAL